MNTSKMAKPNVDMPYFFVPFLKHLTLWEIRLAQAFSLSPMRVGLLHCCSVCCVGNVALKSLFYSRSDC